MIQPLSVQEIQRLYEQDNIIKFYKHPYWRRNIRIKALERDNGECQECKRKGKYSKGRNVHHIKELRDRPDLAYILSNLETLCIQCHNKEHGKEKNIVKKRCTIVDEERW
ncbi:HNH endonuclease [Bacillus thuringiensis]|uniref:Putative HNH nuclease YajD n=1 Tax=Bacillus thuringiensis TaxID=1428 RepID=A0AB36TQT9_BACTU|nr:MULTISPECIES: HNH endonuclease signature motif containing protein [Bacillus cereus group]AVP48417.1 HNH endonuclease [Bacillus cereus]PEE86407.1 HNH endonuclease [Bacillus thuringiensis]PFM87835.1 HNH endonuclease [Bacillus thuringiensis]